jgi:hypothetical protein
MWELAGLVLFGCVVAIFLAGNWSKSGATDRSDAGRKKAIRRENKLRIIGKYREPETRLLNACMGNHDQMERLIGYEMGRRPGTNRNGAIEAALSSLKQDRR